MADLRSDPPRYGTLNLDYIATWDSIPDNEPMWALNLMHYRARAEYRDGRDSDISGQDADDRYAPLGPLAAVGARILLVAPVVEQLAGDGPKWDRIALVRYPNRRAMIEMEASAEFQEAHHHKEAGMAATIVAATYPRPDTLTGVIARDSLLLLQLNASADAPDIATAGCTRIAEFHVDGVIIGDGRAWSTARWDLMSRDDLREVRESVAANPSTSDRYVIAMTPFLDEFAVALKELSLSS